MVSQAELLHSLVPGLISLFLETVWVKQPNSLVSFKFIIYNGRDRSIIYLVMSGTLLHENIIGANKLN